MAKKLSLLIIGLGIFAISIYISFNTIKGDFPIFYHIACIISDPSAPNSLVYSYLTTDKYQIPPTPATNYSYSMAVAYVLSPLALLPYYWAKSVFIFINFISYLFALIILLRYFKAKDRWFSYTFLLSILWFPFFMDIIHGQTNSIIFLLVVLGVLYATKDKAYLAGVFLGLGALIKLFPIAIAMVLGLKNWRIFVGCAMIVFASFLIPDSYLWIPSLARISKHGYTFVYHLLSPLGKCWFYLYSGIIGGTTAIIAWKARQEDYFYLAALAVPAAFLASPIIEIYHLTILIMTYYCLIAMVRKKKFVLFVLSLSVLMIYSATSLEWLNNIQFAGIFWVWVVSLIQINRLSYKPIKVGE